MSDSPRPTDPDNPPRGRVESVQVGKVALLHEEGSEKVYSAFRKGPVVGRVRVLDSGLEGDEQADRKGHGAPRKAVYAYPTEHYPRWREELPELSFPPGSFGENLTTSGLLESELRAGDTLAIGSARLTVTQPRFPCFKLGLRFDRPTMVKEFARSLRSGFYLTVEKEGELGAGDPIRVSRGGAGAPTILEMFRERTEPD